MIDLHTHSIYSDGEYTPEKLVQKAVKFQIRAMALTDHDTVAGIPEFLDACDKLGIEGVPGIEFSVIDDEEEDKQLHILGYFIDWTHPLLKQHEELMGRKRQERVLKIVERLQQSGIDIPDSRIQKLKQVDNPGRVHIARILVEGGFADELSDAFHKFLIPGKPAFVPKPSFESAEIIDLIHRAGGLAILAHPVYLKCKTYDELYQWLESLKQAGIDGVEVIYPETPKKLIHRLLDWVSGNDLLITGGSDFHGENIRSGIHLGKGAGDMYIPYVLLEKMRERLSEIRNENR